MKRKFLIIPIVLTAVLVTIMLVNICIGRGNNQLYMPRNSVYYWKTTFSLDNYEVEFLKRHDVEKVYLRFFDVDINGDNVFSDKCVPVATLDLDYGESSLRDIKDLVIVPVVFITPDAIREYRTFTDDLAHRLKAMCDAHNLNIDEVQFDCDWTSSTRDDFYQFLKDERQALKKYFMKDVRLSSTIRLHQLAQAPPEVEYGVLMCYNTGNFKKFDTKNSILDVEDVKPYLKYLKSYELPLTLALPTYSWHVEFDENKEFVRLSKPDHSAHNVYKPLGNNIYEVDNSYQGQRTKYVRFERVSSETILQVKELVEDKCGSLPIVLYHLDSKQLSKYTEDEIDSFYN